jgi:tripartite-type tricarboxylate transporter receptor subunit TctC
MKRVLIFCLILFVSLGVFAQGAKEGGEVKYPTKPIQIVVPANPGGDTDMTARFIAKEMEPLLGVSIPIVNMAGAAGAVASNDVITSPKDGHKVIYFHTDIIVSNLLGVSPYQWEKSFEIAGIPSSVENFGLFAHKDAPFNTLQEMIAYGKTHKLAYATDTGSINQVLGRVIQKKAGIEFIEIDAGNAADRVAALKGKQIDLVSLPYSVPKDYVESGEFKCLGIMASERNTFLPNVPTFKEQGMDISYTKFFFFGFPKGTPQNVIDTFSNAMEKATKTDSYKEGMLRYDMVPAFMPSREAVQFMRNQEAEYQAYIDMIL